MDDEKKRFDGSSDGLSDGPWSSPFGDLLEGQRWGGDGPLRETTSAAPTIGTPQEDVGKQLELHGVPVQSYQHGTIFHLAQELGQGHKVIISVDSGEMWGNSVRELIQDQLGFQQADHAVVSGIDTSDPSHPQVIVSDPGTGQAAARYPLEQFLDAWADSDLHMATTTEPAPSHLPEMAHFDCEAGHIPEVVGMPWEEFEAFETHPEEWAEQFEAEHDSRPWDFAGAEEAAPALVHEAAHTPEAEHEADVAEEAALDAEGRRHLDEIDRAALRRELDSALDPDAFTNKYDD